MQKDSSMKHNASKERSGKNRREETRCKNRKCGIEGNKKGELSHNANVMRLEELERYSNLDESSDSEDSELERSGEDSIGLAEEERELLEMIEEEEERVGDAISAGEDEVEEERSIGNEKCEGEEDKDELSSKRDAKLEMHKTAH